MATFKERAISDMRIPGYGGSYATSYALNDSAPLGRPSSWPESSRAMLNMGRYPYTPPGQMCEAFTSTNPDQSNVSWVSESVKYASWNRITLWGEVVCATQFGVNHTPGWVNNTRVMVWDAELWIRMRSTGQWVLIRKSSALSGGQYRGDYSGDYQGAADIRSESAGGTSFRVTNNPSAPGGALLVHYWWGGLSQFPLFNAYEVMDVVSAHKTALVLHNPTGADDREYSRFLNVVGADYYPSDGSVIVYPGVGFSRFKFVTAKWPNWQWHIMHTMTEADVNSIGLPPSLSGLSEGAAEPGPDPDPGPSGDTPPWPTVCRWTDVVANAGPPVEYAWDGIGVSQIETVGGLPPPMRRKNR